MAISCEKSQHSTACRGLLRIHTHLKETICLQLKLVVLQTNLIQNGKKISIQSHLTTHRVRLKSMALKYYLGYITYFDTDISL